MKFVKGSKDYADFILDAVVYSERSGQDHSIYESVFDLTEEELREFLKEVFEENIDDIELCYQNFTVLIEDDKPKATLSSWIEGEGNSSSNFVKSIVFPYFLNKDKWRQAQEPFKLLQEINIDRTSGCPQFESVYVDKRYRGQGLLKKLFQEVESYYSNDYEMVEMISMESNMASHKAFTKCGFEIGEAKTSKNEDILKYSPGKGKIKWIKKFK